MMERSSPLEASTSSFNDTTHRTSLECPSRTPRQVPFTVSQTRSVRSRDPDATLHLLNATTHHTRSRCPFKVDRHRACSTSQTRNVQSKLPETTQSLARATQHHWRSVRLAGFDGGEGAELLRVATESGGRNGGGGGGGGEPLTPPYAQPTDEALPHEGALPVSDEDETSSEHCLIAR